MDSISQFVLGAAVGEAVLGKKIGNRALWLGGLMGTLPDLDVLLGGSDPIRQVLLHRGITHSIFGIAVATPIIAWLLLKWQAWKHNRQDFSRQTLKFEETNYKNWLTFVFLALITHPLLDCFTTYGTQLFLPFSDYRVGFNTIFVADPLYTIPFLICVLAAGRLLRDSKKRRFINWLGIGISCAYLLFTVFNKFYIDDVFKDSLEKQEISYKRFMTSPSPLNQVLWSANVEARKGFYIGAYSHLDKSKDVEFSFLPKDFSLRTKVLDDSKMDVLRWFSNDYYVLTQRDNHIEYADLRFGPFDVWDVSRDSYGFVFRLVPKDGGIIVEQDQGPPEFEGGLGKYWNDFWRRVRGI